MKIKMNEHLYLRDPESTELGRNIVRFSIDMIDELGFESFTFKKLAAGIGTTEASIYRYFDNKHKLLTYITTWFWTWLEYQLIFNTNNVKEPRQKIETIVNLLTFNEKDEFIIEHVNKVRLQNIVISEGDKSFLTKHIVQDNKAMLFKPYKDLCHRIAEIFLEYRPGYPYPHSLASSLIVAAHHQIYFKANLPRLTDFGGKKDSKQLTKFLNHIIFSALDGYSK